MKKLIFAAVTATLIFAAMSAQADEAMKGGLAVRIGESPFAGALGFINPNGSGAFAERAAPTVGGRQWFSFGVGVDLGVGYSSFKAESGTLTEKFTGYSLDAGVPIVLKKFEKANLIFRPGFQWGSLEDDAGSNGKIKFTMIGVSGELEAEWMVTDNLSLSASQGFAWSSLEDDQSPGTKLTSIGTTGSNFTELGFTIYLW